VSAPARRSGPGRADVVYAGLLLATVATVWFTTRTAHELLSARGASVAVLVVAFAKAHFVVSDFMGLRRTATGRLFDAWLVVVCAGCVVLTLR
jgi:hypothetical protein